MKRLLILVLVVISLSPIAQARDDGGFGKPFVNLPPSALAIAPDSQIAQTSIISDPSDPAALQQIMPAAGDPATGKDKALKAAPAIAPEKSEPQK